LCRLAQRKAQTFLSLLKRHSFFKFSNNNSKTPVFYSIGPRLGKLTWPPSWRGRRGPDDFWGRPVGPHPPWPGTGSIQVLKPILPLHNFVILLYKISNLDTKVHTFVQNFIPMYKISYLCTKFHTFVQNLIPMYKILYICTKLHTFAQNFIP
jgi:hypothetical protein